MSLHKLDEEHGAGARPGHLACAEIKLSRRGSPGAVDFRAVVPRVYSVRIKYEATAAFTSQGRLPMYLSAKLSEPISAFACDSTRSRPCSVPSRGEHVSSLPAGSIRDVNDATAVERLHDSPACKPGFARPVTPF